MSVSTDQVVQAKLQTILADANLMSAPFDSISFEALKEYLRSTVAEDDDNEDNMPPLQHVEVRSPPSTPTVPGAVWEVAAPSATAGPATPSLQKQSSFLTNDNSTLDSPGTSGAVPGAPGSASLEQVLGSAQARVSVEDRILEQLQFQTSLILDLQRRVDELSGIVQDQQRMLQQGVSFPVDANRNLQKSFSLPRGTEQKTSQRFIFGMRSQRQRDVPPTEEPPPDQPPIAPDNPTVIQFHVDQEPRQDEAIPPPQEQQQRRRGFIENLRETKSYKLMAIFTALRRREVPDLRVGLMVKVLFMLAILSSRAMSSSRRNSADGQIPSKFYFLAVVVVFGFFLQTGYVNFLYKFLVKENYPYRVFVLDEDTDEILRDINTNPRPPPPRPNAPRGMGEMGRNGDARADAPENREDADGWRQTFLGGQIVRPRRDQGAGAFGAGLVKVVYDIFLVLGAFVLSIFPMWRPQADRPADDEDEGNEGMFANNNFGGPGQVNPPRDAMEPEEDDEDEDDELYQ